MTKFSFSQNIYAKNIFKNIYDHVIMKKYILITETFNRFKWNIWLVWQYKTLSCF